MACVIAVGVCGCSFAFVHGHPDPASNHPVGCTHGFLAPGLDGAVAAFGAAALKSALSPCPSLACTASTSVTVADAVGTAVFAASAIYGMATVTACDLRALVQPPDPDVPPGGVVPVALVSERPPGDSGSASGIAAPASLPDELDREAAVCRMRVVVGDLATTCGPQFPDAVGTARVHVEVAPDGAIAQLVVTGTLDLGLGGCVAAAVRPLHFAASRRGGGFTYPFAFGATAGSAGP